MRGPPRKGKVPPSLRSAYGPACDNVALFKNPNMEVVD